jgi:hypothetical protein
VMKGGPVINMMGMGGGRFSDFLCSATSVPPRAVSPYTAVSVVSVLIVLLDGVNAHWLGGKGSLWWSSVGCVHLESCTYIQRGGNGQTTVKYDND